MSVTSDMRRLMALKENMGGGKPSPLQLMLLGKIDSTVKAPVTAQATADRPPAADTQQPKLKV